jgi:hypothetical protein
MILGKQYTNTRCFFFVFFSAEWCGKRSLLCYLNTSIWFSSQQLFLILMNLQIGSGMKSSLSLSFFFKISLTRRTHFELKIASIISSNVYICFRFVYEWNSIQTCEKKESICDKDRKETRSTRTLSLCQQRIIQNCW